MHPKKVEWGRVFPAVVTPFHEDLSLDLPALEKLLARLLAAGVGGITVTGSVGENYALSPEEKREVVRTAVQVTGGRVPVLAGVAELTTALACRYAEDCARLGVDGLMVLPALVYKADAKETMTHYREVAKATGLPMMLYNNPVAYGVDLTPEHYAEMADEPCFVAIKESAADMRRLGETVRLTGERYTMFVGIDDYVLEGVVQGAKGFVAGFINAFPEEFVKLFDLALAGKWDEARATYRWLAPVMHLDHEVKFVQCIKLAMAIAGTGHERIRPPRYALEGALRARVDTIVRRTLDTRPKTGGRRMRTAS